MVYRGCVVLNFEIRGWSIGERRMSKMDVWGRLLNIYGIFVKCLALFYRALGVGRRKVKEVKRMVFVL